MMMWKIWTMQISMPKNYMSYMVTPNCGECNISYSQNHASDSPNKGNVWGLSHKVPHDYICNIVDVCGPFT